MGLFNMLISRIGDSKTYVMLIIIAFIAFFVCLIAALFGQQLWEALLQFLFGQSVVAGVRGVANDGAPKLVAAMKDPNSTGANPPSAMLSLQQQNQGANVPENLEVR